MRGQFILNLITARRKSLLDASGPLTLLASLSETRQEQPPAQSLEQAAV